MTETRIYQEIAERTGGACMLGVVGPVRTGKSTFIKRFMESLVIPHIENTYMRERAKDELPQSGSGRSIMTAEPKFVPEEAVNIQLGEDSNLAVRLVDCVGYMVEGAAGQTEDGEERLVTTPWFDHEVTMTEAAEQGTGKVIREHSTLGIVVTTDGSICDIPRENYVEPEARVIRELKAIGKPFVVLLNCVDPDTASARALAAELRDQYGVDCLPVNCQELGEHEIVEILRLALEAFPFGSMGFTLPEWVDSLAYDDPLKTQLFDAIRSAAEGIEKLRDRNAMMEKLGECPLVSKVQMTGEDLGKGTTRIRLELPRTLYYELLTERTGVEIENDGDLMRILTEMSAVKQDYDLLRDALEQVRTTGYGVVKPSPDQMHLEEPQIVRQGGKYNVKLKASAPAIHMLMTRVESEVTPAISGESASEDILGFLLQGFDGDMNRIWESNIFGKSLNALAEEGLTAKLEAMPENAKTRLRETLERLINENSSGLICILL